jgi:hypothetical protein
MTQGFNWGEQRKAATLILEGDFPVVITEAVAGKSTNDKPQIKIKTKITSGPYVGRVNKSQFTYSPENPNAVKMFFGQMTALGLGDAFFNGLSGFSQEEGFARIATELQGKQAIAVFANRPWGGSDRESIDGWKPLSGAPAAGFAPAAATAVALPAAAPLAVPAVAAAAAATALPAPTTATPPPADPF